MRIEEITQLMAQAAGNDEKISLLSVDLAIRPFLKKQPKLKEAIYAAAVPHSFTSKTLQELLKIKPKEAANLYETMRGFSFVERSPSGEGSSIHNRTRRAVLHWMQHDDPKTYRLLSGRMVGQLSPAIADSTQVELVYHLLIANPDSGGPLLWDLFQAWTVYSRPHRTQMLAAMLKEHLGAKRLKDSALACALLIIADLESNYVPLKVTEKRLKEALAIYRRLRDSRFVVNTLNEFAELQHFRGRARQALTTNKEAVHLAKRLAARAPGDIEIQRIYSVSLDRLGKTLSTLELWDDALDAYIQSMVISRTLAEKQPENPRWQRDLFVSYMRLGRVHHGKKQPKESLDAYEAARDIAARLCQFDPANTEWQRDYSIALHHAADGIAEVVHERMQEVEALLREAHEIRLRLVESDPLNAMWRRDLSHSHDKLGEFEFRRKRYSTARKFHDDALAIRNRLVEADSLNTMWQRDLAVSYTFLGKIFEAMGLFKTAKEMVEKELKVVKKLTRIDPKRSSWQRDLKETRERLRQLKRKIAKSK